MHCELDSLLDSTLRGGPLRALLAHARLRSSDSPLSAIHRGTAAVLPPHALSMESRSGKKRDSGNAGRTASATVMSRELGRLEPPKGPELHLVWGCAPEAAAHPQRLHRAGRPVPDYPLPRARRRNTHSNHESVSRAARRDAYRSPDKLNVVAARSKGQSRYGCTQPVGETTEAKRRVRTNAWAPDGLTCSQLCYIFRKTRQFAIMSCTACLRALSPARMQSIKP